MIDYYQILQISKSSNSEEIKKAYRKLAIYCHPDKNRSINSTEAFIKVNEAYSILIDPSKRQIYDLMYQEYQKSKKEATSTYNNIFEKEKDEAIRKATLSFEDFSKIINRELGKAAKSAPKVIFTIWLMIFILVMLGLLFGLIK